MRSVKNRPAPAPELAAMRQATVLAIGASLEAAGLTVAPHWRLPLILLVAAGLETGYGAADFGSDDCAYQDTGQALKRAGWIVPCPNRPGEAYYRLTPAGRRRAAELATEPRLRRLTAGLERLAADLPLACGRRTDYYYVLAKARLHLAKLELPVTQAGLAAKFAGIASLPQLAACWAILERALATCAATAAQVPETPALSAPTNAELMAGWADVR